MTIFQPLIQPPTETSFWYLRWFRNKPLRGTQGTRTQGSDTVLQSNICDEKAPALVHRTGISRTLVKSETTRPANSGCKGQRANRQVVVSHTTSANALEIDAIHSNMHCSAINTCASSSYTYSVLFVHSSPPRSTLRANQLHARKVAAVAACVAGQDGNAQCLGVGTYEKVW